MTARSTRPPTCRSTPPRSVCCCATICASPDDGSLTLVFADNPLALRQWSVVDAQRQETRVSLFDIETGGSFDQSLFVFTPPMGGGTSSGGG